MTGYTFHGLYKYSQLWWKSYRLMMRKERFKKLFLMVMTAILLLYGQRLFVMYGSIIITSEELSEEDISSGVM